jgi:polyketide synthase PksN
MASIKKYILDQVAKRALSQDEAKQFLTELAASAESRDEDFAIIGMAGRFPRAENVQQFWNLLRQGVNCIRDYPDARRKDIEPILRNPHYADFLIGDSFRQEDIRHVHKPAGYLDEIDKFDAGFFGIPPAEATYMDPYQRLALEVAWEAIEDAGYGGKRLYGTSTGVFIGKDATNYSLYRYCSTQDPMQLTGSWESIIASRISYIFDFRGPCLLVDSACSAGLVSVHMALQSLQNGECDTAIAGGINLSVTGELSNRYQGGMNMDSVESEDSIIRTFDGRANGTVWGEGIGLVVLKRLSKALQDRDHIHAVIKGSAINNDGASNGLTAPKAEAQEEVIVRAWQKARIDPETLSYVEAHGTGTVLGDPIEFKGLTSAFQRYTNKRQFCAIGSLKTNMGHLVAASGVASLFKVVKSLQDREMAPTINFGKPNPYINFLGSPLYVNDTIRPWVAASGPRRAALSSFGFSHTNCHMVVEEAPPKTRAAPRKKAYALSLSAKTGSVLVNYVERLRAFCQGEGWNLADLCYTSNIGRGHYAHRLAVVASTEQELRNSLTAAAESIGGGPKHAFVLYGQHQIVSDRKKLREVGEITDKEKKNLTSLAGFKLDKFLVEDGDAAQLLDLCQQYVEGADIDWERFYADEPRHRLSMPTYPFQRVRVWAAPRISRLTAFDPRLHPLIDRVAERSADGKTVFESVFQVESHWVLSDHKIKGRSVVPGTTYLEMARFAATYLQDWQGLEFRDVFFLVPMMVENDESRRVRVVLRESGTGYEFEIESEGTDGAWIRHVEGRVGPLHEAPGERLDIQALQARADESIEDYKGESDTGVFQFGPHWDAVRAAWRIGGDAMARLVLPEGLRHETDQFLIHPSMLDNAVNLTSQTMGATFLPFMYKSYRVYAGFTPEMHTYLRLKTQKLGGETLSYDVILTDGAGRVIGEINDYVAKKVHSFAFGESEADFVGAECLGVRWVLANPSVPVIPTIEGSLVLIGADGDAALSGLAEGFAMHGVDCHILRLGDANSSNGFRADDQGLFALVNHPFIGDAAGIVFATDFAASDGTSAGYLTDAVSFAARRRLGVDALFRLTQALLNAKAKLPWGLCVLTADAFHVDGSEPTANPLGAVSAALGGVIGMEYRHLPCRVLDASRNEGGGSLAWHIMAAKPGLPVALRGGDVFVRELHTLKPNQAAPVTFKEDGAYLITGGLGGLGLATASFIASRAKANVVLLGRSTLAHRQDWESLALQSTDPTQAKRYSTLLELEQRLGSITYVQADVADHQAMAAAVATIMVSHGGIRGVFHLAGVAGEGFLMRKEFSRFDGVLSPKLDGSRNLLALIPAQGLDFCVLYSSITALTGGEGQGDYAAANSFLDALAEHRDRFGGKLVSINWPGWKGVGMAADFGIREEDMPFTPLSADEAFERLERILAQGLAQALPSSPNGAVLAAVRGDLPFVFSAELDRRIGGGQPALRPEVGEAISVQIRGKSEDDLTETESILCQVYAAVLGLTEIDVYTNFQDMGGNSIIATHLLRLIEESFPGLADISDVFSYPSIDEMATHIDEKRGGSRPAAEAKPATDWEGLVDQVMDGTGSIDSLLEKL